MKSIVAVIGLFVALAVIAPPTSAQLPGGVIYSADNAPVAEFFMLTISGTTFVAAILTFGPSGNNGRWFAATGTTDGTTGSGSIILPTGFSISTPPGLTFSFTLDGPGAATGSFATTGMQGLLSLPSGRWRRVFP